MMGISVAEYERTPALTVDWDIELAAMEDRAHEAIRKSKSS